MTTKLSGDIIRFFTKSVPKSTTEPELGAEQDYEPVPDTWKYVKSILSRENVVFTTLDDNFYKLTFTYNKNIENVLVFDENVPINYWYIVSGGGGGGGAIGGSGANTGGGGGGGDTKTNLETMGISNIPTHNIKITVGNGGSGEDGVKSGGAYDWSGKSGNKGTESTLVADNNNTITALGGNGGNGGRPHSVGTGGRGGGNGGSGAIGSVYKVLPYERYVSKNADNGFLIYNSTSIQVPDKDAKYYYGWGGSWWRLLW